MILPWGHFILPTGKFILSQGISILPQGKSAQKSALAISETLKAGAKDVGDDLIELTFTNYL